MLYHVHLFYRSSKPFNL